MPTHVLATKLYVPAPHSRIVARPRLLERLNAELNSGCKLTLACAPAGFGKTTLLSGWIADCGRRHPDMRVAWLSLDERDNDLSRFLTYLIVALQGIEADIGSEAMSFLHSAQVVPVELVLTALINDVADTGGEIILVLDDYHLISARPIHDAVNFLLDHLPSQLHLAIATRSDPPIPLARLRSRGELTELRASDLRFTPDEAADFLNQVMGLGLSAGDIAALESRTEGWIAGLQLAGLSLREHDDVSGFIRAFTGSHRFIIDYLVEEVLQRQTYDVRRFLLSTAVLDRLTGSLCEAVIGEGGGSEMLETLERENLFVVPLDDRRQWYRYHHLFADVLRSRILKEQPGRVPALHRLASEWYERNDLPEEAVRHALAAKDFGRAAALMEAALPAMRRNRQDAMLLGWLKSLPDEVVRSNPVLSVFRAHGALVAGDLETVEPWLRDAEQRLGAPAGSDDLSAGAAADAPVDGEELRRLPSTIAMYRAALAQALGDVPGTAQHARRALELTQAGDHLALAAAAGFLGLAEWAAGDVETALGTFSRAVTSLHAAGGITDALSSTVVLADMWIARGRLQEARRIYERALQLATAQGGPVPRATADLHVGIADLHREFGELGTAVQHLETSTALGPGASLTEHRYRWFMVMARVREAEGDLEGAIELLDEAGRAYSRGFFPDLCPIAAMKARIRIRQGSLHDALNWARERGLSTADDLTYLHEFEHVTLARLLIAQYRASPAKNLIDEAVGLLDHLLSDAESSGRNGSVNEILVLQSLAQEAQGHRPLALEFLERALVETAPEGYVRLFLDEGPPMDALLREAKQHGVAADRVGRLLQATGTAPDKAHIPPQLAEPLPEALSQRELQVLRLLSTELTGPEIARELFVSVNTLRTHTKHIFAKLEVNSRPAAVRHAKERGLI